MFFKYAITATAFFLVLLTFEVQAKTFKYEIQELHSSGAGLEYPGLDLSGANSAILIVDQENSSAPIVITSLEIKFPNASSLSVRNFYTDGGLIRASVNDAWVYRQLNIEVHGLDILNINDQFINISGYVSEADGFIGGHQPENLGQPLFHAGGRLVDVTPSKVVDVKALTVNGSRLKLSLNNNTSAVPNSGDEHAIVIDSLWFGRGEASLYFPIHLGSEAKFVKPYKISISTISGPEGDEHSIRILLKDERGNEFSTEELPLQHLLDEAYRNN